MRVQLRYGRGTLAANIPDTAATRVLRMNSLPALPDPVAALREALEHPADSPPLRELARGRSDAVIVISDVTRPFPNKLLLPPLLTCLESAGLARERITLLVATGLHRPNEGAELEEMVGAEIASGCRIINHHAREDDEHEFIGTTSLGAEAFIDKRYLEADLKILTGLIEPHLMAGYSGGRKLVCPGLASWRTIKFFHSPQLLEHPAATAGVIDGNPVHQTSLEVARMAGVDFIVNVTLDEPRNITGLFAGELEAAHLAGVERVNEMVRVPLLEPADIVVTCSAGYPLDTTFYQSIKGLVGALPAVKEGGTMIMAAAMSEGLGSPEFSALVQSMGSADAYMQKLLSPDYFQIDQWQAEELLKVLKRADVLCYSDAVSPDVLERCLVSPIASIEAGLERAFQLHGADASVCVIPEGPYVMPVVG